MGTLSLPLLIDRLPPLILAIFCRVFRENQEKYDTWRGISVTHTHHTRVNNADIEREKDKKAAKKDEKKEEEKPVEKSEKECQLEAELKKVEDEYKATREKVNELRLRNHMLKDKSVEIQDEAAEYLTFIDRKRQTRQSRITAVNDQQQSTLAELEEEDAGAEEKHQARLAQLHEENRLALFKRSGLKDQLLNLSDAITLKEKNDKRIKELERELARKKFKMASQEAAKEAKTQLKVDAHKIIKERTATARKTNKQLRDQLIKHIDDTKVLGVQRKVLEAQCRDLQAEINCLKSFKRR